MGAAASINQESSAEAIADAIVTSYGEEYKTYKTHL